RQHQELGAGTNRVPEPGAGSGTAANIKGSVTRSRDNYLENRRFHQGVIGGNQKFAGDSHGKNTENCATFCAPLAKSCALSRSPLGICSLAFYPQRYQPKSCTMAFGL
ncbi:hypothetical protein, partial [Pseudomonas aeruginosa]|uniref:hypothetical protein n=1 Tax=Pseudomonas aeruginosa TaxID=287 RepID=UPI001C3CB7DA